MTERAIELLNLPEDQSCFLLDIGCGSGLSGELLDEDGHMWVGVDVAPSMLEVALEREVEGDLFLQDIGQGFGFRPGAFDGAIRSASPDSVIVKLMFEQYLCSAMVMQRRCLLPFPTTATHPILHHPPRLLAESLSSDLPILPFFRRPGSAHHPVGAASGVRRRDSGGLPKLAEGAEDVSLPDGGAAGNPKGPGGRGGRCGRAAETEG